MRVNMVPRDGGNTFRGQLFGNYAGEGFVSDNCGSAGIGKPCTRSNLTGSTTFNPNNTLTNVAVVKKIWDFNPSIGGPIVKNKLWFHYTFRHQGVNKTVADSYYDKNPSPFAYEADTNRVGIDDGHIVSNAGRLSWAATSKDKVSFYMDNQRKYRNHWGITATIPPEAAGVQVTPSSYVNVTKWTRTQTNRLLLEGGVGIYNQEYTELYQPSVTGLDRPGLRPGRHQRRSRSTPCWTRPPASSPTRGRPPPITSRRCGPSWEPRRTSPAPTRSGSARRSPTATGDCSRPSRVTCSTITYNAGRPVSATLRLPTDRRNGIKADTGIYLQDRWSHEARHAGTSASGTTGSSASTRESEVLPSRINGGFKFPECSDGNNNPKAGCAGTVQNWKDISPRVGFAMDVFGNGRTAIKASWARYVAGQQIAVANAGNPVTVLGLTDTRAWTDLDGNGLPLDANGQIQFNELTASASTPTFGKNVSTTSYDPEVLNGWGKRGYNNEMHVRDAAPAGRPHLGQRRLLPAHVRQPDVHGRPAVRREQLRHVLHHGAVGSRTSRAAATTRSAA